MLIFYDSLHATSVGLISDGESIIPTVLRKCSRYIGIKRSRSSGFPVVVEGSQVRGRALGKGQCVNVQPPCPAQLINCWRCRARRRSWLPRLRSHQPAVVLRYDDTPHGRGHTAQHVGEMKGQGAGHTRMHTASVDLQVNKSCPTG